MNDELLMRLIDGNISEEDMETIINKLSSDKELLKEWLMVANAARMADITPAINISKDKALDKVQNILGKTPKTFAYAKSVDKRKFLNLNVWYVVSALAASVLIAVVTIFLTTKSEVLIQGNSNSYFVQHLDSIDSNESIELTPVVRYDNNASMNSVIVHEFERVSPAEITVLIELNNLSNSCEFIYKSENVKFAELKIKDANGELLINKVAKINNDIRCTISVAELYSREELKWEFCLTFIDDFIFTDSGVIKFVGICE